MDAQSVLDCSVKNLEGQDMGAVKDFASGKKAILFVNVASE